KPPLRLLAIERVLSKELKDHDIDAELQVIADPNRGHTAVVKSGELEQARKALAGFAMSINFEPF
ncbi:MAG: hypothetical protein AAGJ50_14615, partial [Pseudomonadota bacterium]